MNKMYLNEEKVVVEALTGDVANLTVLEEKTADAATEKHVPFIEEKEDGYLVKVGQNAAHPMTEEHWIQFIEIEIDGKMLHRVKLNPGDAPEAYFKVAKGSNVVAREYCNLHGLWKKIG